MTTEKQQTKKKVTDFYSMESAMYTRIYRELDMLDSMTFDILLRSFQKRLDKDTVTRIKSSRNKASSLMAALHDFLVTVPEAYEIIVKCDKKMPLVQLLLDSYSDEIMPNSSSSTPPPPPPPSSSSSAQIISTNITSNKSGAFSLSTAGSDGSNGNESNERGTTTTTKTTGLVVGELVPEAMSLLKASPASTMTTPVFSTSAQLQTPPSSSSLPAAAAASTSIYSLLNSDSSTHLLIEIFESIMPVYYEPAPVTLAEDPSQGHYKAWSISKPRWGGRFDLVHLPERNMSLKRKLFLNEFDYLREMKMVKHRHQNLYTAEFIFKGFNDKNLYLLYSLESYTSMFLNELAAQIKSTQEPSEYDAMQQLGLLRDISGALAYLHEATDHKEKILHGNLLPENIIVEMTLLAGKTVYVPKLYNFENAIEISRQEVDMYDTQIKEELFNFGLIIFLVLGWTPLNKKECEQMHRENSNRIELYERLKLEAPDPYNAFKYRLFKRFCVLTAPTTVGASTTSSSSNLARPTTTSSAASQNNDMIGIHKNIKKTWNDYNNIFS